MPLRVHSLCLCVRSFMCLYSRVCILYIERYMTVLMYRHFAKEPQTKISITSCPVRVRLRVDPGRSGPGLVRVGPVDLG